MPATGRPAVLSRLWAWMLMAAVLFLLVPGVARGAVGSIEGEVTGPGPAPLGGVTVCAYAESGQEGEYSCEVTAADGSYAVKGLAVGEYKVEFWSDLKEPSYVAEYYDDEEFWSEADLVQVEDGQATTGIDAALAEAVTIKGEVRAASLGGPVQQAMVCALVPGGPVGCTLVRSDGSYVLSGLPAGSYRISFSPAFNLYNLLNQSYDHKRWVSEADWLTLAPGETRSGVDADLEEGAEIRGTVYSAASGDPLASVRVCALFFEEEEEAWVVNSCFSTSSEGSYEIWGLSSDVYKVVFSPNLEYFGVPNDAYPPQYYDGKATLSAADPLPLSPPEVVTGIDGHLGPPAAAVPSTQTSVLAPSAAAVLAPRPKPKRCRAGFRKAKVQGKSRCMKIKRKHSHRRGGGGVRGAR